MEDVYHTLNQLLEYIDNIISTHHIDQSSYYAAVDRIQNGGLKDPITQMKELIPHTPPPIKKWLSTIQQSAWKLLLSNSKNYLDNIWSTTVLPFYDREIKMSYPINPNADTDINLQDFTQFFGPGGSIAEFFNNYLAPFVNMRNAYWTWNKLDGRSLPISQKTLEVFIRASLIQQMFFSKNNNFPSFTFDLIPQKLLENTREFLMDLGGQVVELRRDMKQRSQLTWPGPSSHLLTLRFIANDGRSTVLTYSGPWAWFKLLSESDLNSTHNIRKYQLTIRVGNQGVIYDIIADNIINPYLPNVLMSFKCPDKL